MQSFTVSHKYDVSSDVLFDTLTDPAIDRYLVEHIPEVKSRELVETREEGDIVERTVKASLNPTIPGFVRSIVSADMFVWKEVLTGNKKTKTIDMTISPIKMADKFKFTGRIEVKDTPDGGSCRDLVGKVEVLIPIVGKTAEKFMVEELRKNMVLEGNAVAEYLESRK